MPSPTQTPGASSISISLTPVPDTLEAAHTLVTIHNDAFKDDSFLELMYGPLAEEEDSFANDILTISREDPTARFTQAVLASDSSGTETEPAGKGSDEVVAWAWWNIYPDKKAYLAAKVNDDERARKAPPTSLCPAAYLDWKREVVGRREKWIGRVLEEGEGGGVAILQVLVVHPSYQNLGIGTKLLQHGLQEVKSLNLPAWLEASDEGLRVYTKCGFRDVQDDIVLDITKYGREGEPRRGVCMLMDTESQLL